MNERIQLMIQYLSGLTDDKDSFAWMNGADALIVDPCSCDKETVTALPVEHMVFDSINPRQDLELQHHQNTQWVCKEGLEKTAKLRDEWKDLDWVPQLSVFRPRMSYRFSGPAVGEGFSFYIPDTAAIRGWRVTDGDILLSEAIKQAKTLGFSSLWLHSIDAENESKGLELDMLDRTQDSGLTIWISGGVSEQKHLQNLTRAGGASAVIVSSHFAEQHGIEPLSQALAPLEPEPVVPEVNFTCGQGYSPA